MDDHHFTPREPGSGVCAICHPLPTNERPAFPSDGVCPECGSASWNDVETGYARISSAVFEDGVLHVWNDGWDDMSEGGDEQYVACDTCGTAFAHPSNVEYDG